MHCAAQSRICLAVVAVLCLPACRTAQSTQPVSLDASAPLTSGRASDALACGEIRSARVDDAYEAVMRFRPEFLRPSGAPAAADPGGAAPVVYVDDVRQGGPEMLRTIPVTAIVEIRYLGATTAADRFGPLYAGGVIAVRTRR